MHKRAAPCGNKSFIAIPMQGLKMYFKFNTFCYKQEGVENITFLALPASLIFAATLKL